MDERVLAWLLDSAEPWTIYRTLTDLLELDHGDARVVSARHEMLEHTSIRELIQQAQGWPGEALKRHNDAKHVIYTLTTLADFGVDRRDAGAARALDAVLARQSTGGAFQSLLRVPKAFGGSGEDELAWMLCDTPSLLYVLLAMGFGRDARVQRATEHLLSLGTETGWGCQAAPDFGKFKGPGRRGDPCPMANVYALKALSLLPQSEDHPAVRAAVELLLSHWDRQGERRYFLFGIGTDFRKLKYPLIWYDILHVMEALSRYDFIHHDRRFRRMAQTLFNLADDAGRFTANSMYRAWKGWSFANKKRPSAWLTFMVLRIRKRVAV